MIRVSNSLDQDQARHLVGPALNPNCCKGLQTKRLNVLMFKANTIMN